MKKLWIGVLTLCLCCALSGCRHWHRSLETENIVSATVHTHTAEGALNKEEVARFVELYNAAAYDGKATGEGCTPEFGVRIALKDGESIYINEFCGRHDLEVGRFYLESDELFEYMQSLVKKYCDSSAE